MPNDGTQPSLEANRDKITTTLHSNKPLWQATPQTDSINLECQKLITVPLPLLKLGHQGKFAEFSWKINLPGFQADNPNRIYRAAIILLFNFHRWPSLGTRPPISVLTSTKVWCLL